MKKTVIAVDIDDVLADSTEALRLLVNKRLKVTLLPEHYSVPGEYWNYYERVWQAHGLGEKIAMAELDPQMQEDQSHVAPYAGAAEVLRGLVAKYELIIVTGRHVTWRAATEKWLDVYFPNVFSLVLFAGGKEGLKAKSKGELCAENHVSWLIDDNVEHSKTALAKGVNVVLFGNYGWQQHVPQGVIRCKDWLAVQEYFDGRG